MNIKKFTILILISLIAIAGLKVLNSQQKYVGDYKNGKCQGKGIIEYHNGDRFEGYFVEGKAEGPGKFYLSNGELLEGIWKDNKFEGPGKYTFSNGEVYQIRVDDKWINDKLPKI